MVNEKSTLKELEQQAKNTKLYVDRLVKANTGLTLEEILRLGLREERPEDGGDENAPTGGRGKQEGGYKHDGQAEAAVQGSAHGVPPETD